MNGEPRQHSASSSYIGGESGGRRDGQWWHPFHCFWFNSFPLLFSSRISQQYSWYEDWLLLLKPSVLANSFASSPPFLLARFTYAWQYSMIIQGWPSTPIQRIKRLISFYEFLLNPWAYNSSKCVATCIYCKTVYCKHFSPRKTC